MSSGHSSVFVERGQRPPVVLPEKSAPPSDDDEALLDAVVVMPVVVTKDCSCASAQMIPRNTKRSRSNRVGSSMVVTCCTFFARMALTLDVGYWL